MDPDQQIGYTEREFVMTDPLTGKPIQVNERHWLFLTDTRVECYEYNTRRKQIGKDKFSQEPYTETWERHYAKLSDITYVRTSMWNAAWTKRKVLDVTAQAEKMGVYYDCSERKKDGGWRNQRGGPIIYFYYHGMPKNLAECKTKIEAAMKKDKRK